MDCTYGMHKRRLWLTSSLVTVTAVSVCLAGSVRRPPVEPMREVLVDPLLNPGAWSPLATDHGTSIPRVALALSRAHPRPGASETMELKIEAGEHDGPYTGIQSRVRLPQSRCRSLALWVWSEGGGWAMTLIVEDSGGRWFESRPRALDWSGWQRLDWNVEDASLWKPFLRRDEKAASMSEAVALRQIRFYRHPQAVPRRRFTVGFHELKALTDADGLGAVEMRVRTGVPANLFVGMRAIRLQLDIRYSGRGPIRVEPTVAAVPLLGDPRLMRLDPLDLQPGISKKVAVTIRTPQLGPYWIRISLAQGEAVRHWYTRAGVVRSARAGSGLVGTFGCTGSVEGFDEHEHAAAAVLRRAAGIAWARFGLAWDQVNPAPGVWVWDPPVSVGGAIGRGLRTGGRVYTATLPSAPGIRDEVTLAFWARVAGPQDAPRWPVLLLAGHGSLRLFGTRLDHAGSGFAFSGMFRHRPGTMVGYSSGFAPQDGRWHHYAVTYSRHIKQAALYVDGAARTSVVHDGGPLSSAPDAVRLGAGGPVDLDEVLVYDRALGPADVAALARRSPPRRDGLVAGWDFDGRNPLEGRRASVASRLSVEEPDGVRWARMARDHGLRPLVILGFPPPWAAAQPAEASSMPDLGAWRQYVENVARHYRRLIDAWEVWHEPNNAEFWQPEARPEEYLAVLQVAYEAAKKGNPRCTVVMPALAGPDENGAGLPFLFQLLEHGAAAYCDALSLHPYRTTAPETSGLSRQLYDAASRASRTGPARRIWITEDSRSTEFGTGVSERLQASLLARTFLTALSTGHVDRILWYRLHDPGPDRTVAGDSCGLCYDDLTPKPAFFAYRTLAVLLDGAHPLSPLTRMDGVYTAAFRSGGERLQALWTGGERVCLGLRIGRPSVQITDIMGNSYLRRTEYGVALLDVDDLPLFARFLRPQFRILGRVIAISADHDPGAEAIAGTVHVRNPYPSAREATVSLLCTAPRKAAVPLGAPGNVLVLPPGKELAIPFRLAAQGTAPSSETRLEARVAFARTGDMAGSASRPTAGTASVTVAPR